MPGTTCAWDHSYYMLAVGYNSQGRGAGKVVGGSRVGRGMWGPALVVRAQIAYITSQLPLLLKPLPNLSTGVIIPKRDTTVSRNGCHCHETAVTVTPGLFDAETPYASPHR